MSKKYSKYAKEFKHELELQSTIYDRYVETKRKLTMYEKKVKELNKKAEETQQQKDELDKEVSELRQKESQLVSIQHDLRSN